jgi:hypothetical protein
MYNKLNCSLVGADCMEMFLRVGGGERLALQPYVPGEIYRLMPPPTEPVTDAEPPLL